MNRDFSNIHFIILLGSYDPDTKSLLYEIKEYIAKSFQEEIYPIILEDIEIYRTIKPPYIVMLDKQGSSAYIIDGLVIKDMIHLGCNCETIDEKCLVMLNSILEERYGITLKERLPVLEKLYSLVWVSKLIFVLRDKQYTRCGEYIELIFLLERLPRERSSDIIFLWNKDVELSSMIQEALEEYKFGFRTYSSKQALFDEIHRLVYHRIIKSLRTYT